jgi:hypothetical protein
MVNVIDELVAQWKVLFLCDASEVALDICQSAARVGGISCEPYWQYLGLQSDLGSNAKEELHNVCLNVLSDNHASRSNCSVYEVHERRSKDIVLQKVFFFAIDEGIVEGDCISDDALVIRRRCDLGDTRVYLLSSSELQAHVRGWRAGLIVEYGGEGLEPAADIAQSFAIARQVLRLLPLLLSDTLAGHVAATAGFYVCTRTWLYRWRNRARRCWGLFGAACFFWEEPPRSLTHCILLAEAGVTEAVVTDKVHVESIHAASGWRACGGVRGAACHTLGALMDEARSVTNCVALPLPRGKESPPCAQPCSLKSASIADRHLMFQVRMLLSEGQYAGRGTVSSQQRLRTQLQGISPWAHAAW